MAAISWGKFNRLICIEMALNPNERNDCFVFLKAFRIELDRLIEQSPDIPPSVRKECLKTFKNATDVKKPDILGVLEHTNIFKDTDSRLKKLAADAALVLQQKKGVIKQLVLDDLDTKMRAISIEAARETAKAILEESRKKILAETPKTSAQTFNTRIIQERNRELDRVASSGLVSELKQRISRRASMEALPGAIEAVKKQSDNFVITIPEHSPKTGLSNLVEQSIPAAVRFEQETESEGASGSTEFVTACDVTPKSETEVVIDLSGVMPSVKQEENYDL